MLDTYLSNASTINILMALLISTGLVGFCAVRVFSSDPYLPRWARVFYVVIVLALITPVIGTYMRLLGV